jgi:hypothetical protein
VAVSFPQRGTWAAKSARLAREAARPRLPSQGLWVACPCPTRREPQLPIHRRPPACDGSALSSCSPKANPAARRHLTNSNSRPISGACAFIMTAGPIVMIGGVSAVSWAGLDSLVGPIPAPAYSSRGLSVDDH